MSLLSQFYPSGAGSPDITTENVRAVFAMSGGGGGGGTATNGVGGSAGGGGAGEVIIGSDNFKLGITYPIVVGAGGGASSPGGSTRFAQYTAFGGGSGGDAAPNTAPIQSPKMDLMMGSSGGQGINMPGSTNGVAVNPYAFTATYTTGYNNTSVLSAVLENKTIKMAGSGRSASTSPGPVGGGGGSSQTSPLPGAVGAPGFGNDAALNSARNSYFISGRCCGGGGGGGSTWSSGTLPGGNPGGGNGGWSGPLGTGNATSGSAGTGAGGGGGAWNPGFPSASAGNGGSGYLMIRIPTAYSAATVTGNTTNPGGMVDVGSPTVREYYWTGPGTITFNA